jgi:hypothetical protein
MIKSFLFLVSYSVAGPAEVIFALTSAEFKADVISPNKKKIKN